MSKRLIAMLIGAAAIAVFVTGCGGSSDSSSSLSKSEFIAKADAICQKGDTAVQEGAERFAKENKVDTNKPTKAQQEEVIVKVVAPGILEQAEEIGALGAPSGDDATVAAMVKSVEEGAKQLEEDPGQLNEGKNPLAKASKLAREYGLKHCGEEG